MYSQLEATISRCSHCSVCVGCGFNQEKLGVFLNTSNLDVDNVYFTLMIWSSVLKVKIACSYRCLELKLVCLLTLLFLADGGFINVINGLFFYHRFLLVACFLPTA